MIAKPTVEDLGIDVDAQTWMSSGGPGGTIEVAFVGAGRQSAGVGRQSAEESGESGTRHSRASGAAGEWVLMRVGGDPAQRVLVYDRFEWDCFLDGVKNGEFDDAVELVASFPE